MLGYRPIRTRVAALGTRHCFKSFKHFEKDCAKGTLPAYSFLEPRSFLNPNDMHPPFWLNPHVASSVLAGGLFVKQVYDAVRLSVH